MILTVPADLEARVAPVIGAPFLAKGDDPSGWDCRGLTRWCLTTLCGLTLPDYQDLYDAAIVDRPSGRRERARIIADQLAAQWRPVTPQAGAVAWLRWLGGDGHVGFMLGPRRILHADCRSGTSFFDLDEAGAAYRLIGAFVPAGVTEIRTVVAS